MYQKLLNLCKTIYGWGMTISFFAGGLPVVPFVFAIAIGGSWGEGVAVFLYRQYYPCVILLASICMVIGLIAMYLEKQQGLSLKTITEKTER